MCTDYQGVLISKDTLETSVRSCNSPFKVVRWPTTYIKHKSAKLKTKQSSIQSGQDRSHLEF